MKQLVITKNITTHEYQSLDKYFNEVEKISPIKTEEEVVLAQRIRLGDQKALQQLTKANLRFVISVAKQYQNMGLTLGDLINEGNTGLIIAAKRYDETKGFKFISYAVWWIRQSIISALAEHSRTIRMPYNKLTLLTKIYKASTKLEQEHNRRPTADELADYIGVPAKKISELLVRSEPGVSLDAPFQNDKNHSTLDMLPNLGAGPDDSVMFESIKTDISYSLRVLCQRDREIVTLYFGLGAREPMTMEEIAKRYEITKEHVGRLKEKALQKLRNSTNAPMLKSYLN